MSKIIDDVREGLKSGKYVLVFNQDYESYISDLEFELEDANNTFNGSDGDIPERIVRVISKDGLMMTLSGKAVLSELK